MTILGKDKEEQLKSDATDAAFRLAGRQFLKATREPLIAKIAGHLDPNDPSMRAKIAAFLDTELGEAMVATLLSFGLSLLPESTGDIPKRLAKELRVGAMVDVGDVLADLLMAPLRDLLSGVLRGVEKEAPSLPVESSFPRVSFHPEEVKTAVGETVSAEKKAGLG